ncbi:MAG: 1-deoxy-D-xylulose-5-phosphate reductoisomerase [Candidatus Cloacimonetes bacterium]|nr:1-deoxy-D-xylulose-5-phosphate reductoisomerase [Candidatus Cloacimonadota bacterium]
MKNIAVLGITGSIGNSTIAVIREHPDKFNITLATAHHNTELLFEYAHEFGIKHLVITGSKLPAAPPPGSIIYHGEKELLSLISELDLDIVLNAIAGSAGLLSSITTIESGIDLALANKESLVLAGHLIKNKLRSSKSRVLPVDSEHSAVFQCLEGHQPSEISKIILTASGGPFRDLPLDQFTNITLDKALKHPTWTMGTKVTIDSATMMNKALEVIEAHWLFDTEYDKIEAIMHPQSIIHSFVEFADGSIMAQLSNPTMKLPVLYALSYPQHIPSDLIRTSILDLPQMNFRPLTPERYPLYFLAIEAGKTGGLLPTIINAVNEAAISLFLNHKISFNDIYKLIDQACQTENNISHPDIDTIINTNLSMHTKYLTNYQNYL